MVDVAVNFTLENDEPVNAEFNVQPDVTFTADIKTEISTIDHTKLINRSVPDQHPISAITGLQDALDGITSDVVTEQELSDALSTKQDTLTAGTGISIDENNVISNTVSPATWGNINGTLSNQTDLQNALDGLSSSIDSNHQEIGVIGQTIGAYGNIVTHNVSEFATASQGAKAETALQPNDNISALTNDAGYITSSALSGYATQTWVTSQGYLTGITSSDVTTALGYTPYNSSNPSNYQTATQVANSIATETTNRESADNNLQSQIDAIVSSSDVFDIVGTYAELQAYDITTVPVNDIIKVLVDSTHSGAATYYRCVETGGVKSWSYIGSEGAYYTKAEADAAFVPQTRTVNNKALSANISLTATDVGADVSGAASTAETNAKNYADGLAVNYATAAQGALADTALQPNDNITELNNNAGYITNSALNGYATTSYVDTGLSGKQNTLSQTQMDAVNSGANTTNIAQIATNTSDISTINGLIPAQATTSNQLADKAFVNSSIATNTANFIGTFANIPLLEAFTGPVTNNDYAFVVNSEITDHGNEWATFANLDAYDKTLLTNFDYAWVSNGSNFDLYRFNILNQTWDLRVSDTPKASITLNTAYNRYKATVNGTTSWDYEYTLNNSSFTATQWAAINSGITSGDVTLIGTSLQPNDNISELTNDAGYTSNIGTVTSVNNVNPVNGNVTLSIPTVNDATLTITQGGVSKGTFTANAGSDVTIDLDAGSTPANMVTTNTDQNITGIKTFVGEKRIKFKQSASGNKLGFTLYDNNNKEAAAFEYRPNTINSYPLLSLSQYKGSGTSYISTPIYVGFRCYDNAYNASYNLVAPLAKDARSSFSLDRNYKTFYLPLGITDGNTTVTTASTGLLNISSILPTVNNATLTITQGGTTKGTFTANASSNVTIDLDAGGGSTPSNMVTTDTAQTITGTKTFSGDSWITKIKNTTVTYNYAPASDVWTSIAFVDANDMQMGTVDCWRQPDNSTVMQLNVFGHSGYWGSNLGQSLQFGVDSNSKAFALAPTPRANPNGNEIATVSWVNGSSSDVVHKSGPETITGAKIFAGNGWVTKIQNTSVAYNVAPISEDVVTSLGFADNNDNAMGAVDCWRFRDNSTQMNFAIHAPNGAWASSTLKLYVDANGNASAHAPTPNAGSNGDNISTTAFVHTEAPHLAMPNYATSIALTLPASSGTIQAPKDGYLCIVIDAAAGSYLSIGSNYYQAGPNNGYIGGIYPIKKNDTVYIFYSGLLNTIECKFIPCVGAA